MSVDLQYAAVTLGGNAFTACPKLKNVNGTDNLRVSAKSKSDFDLSFATTQNGMVILFGSLIGYDMDAEDFTIHMNVPEGVRYVALAAFSDCTALRSITLPATLREVGANAFSNCTSLKTVTFAEGTTKIGTHAFFGCTELAEISLPDTLTELSDYLFLGCKKIERITLGTGLKRIAASAFDPAPNCRIEYRGTSEQWAQVKVESSVLKSCKIECLGDRS